MRHVGEWVERKFVTARNDSFGSHGRSGFVDSFPRSRYFTRLRLAMSRSSRGSESYGETWGRNCDTNVPSIPARDPDDVAVEAVTDNLELPSNDVMVEDWAPIDAHHDTKVVGHSLSLHVVTNRPRRDSFESFASGDSRDCCCARIDSRWWVTLRGSDRGARNAVKAKAG